MTDAISFPSNAPPDIVEATVTTFCDDVGEFLRAIEGVWPEDDAVGTLLRGFENTVGSSIEAIRSLARNKLIKTFHENMKPYYERCRQKDGSVFFEAARTVDVLRQLKMDEKWKDDSIDAETRDAIFEWINRLASSSELWSFYARVPRGMLTKLTASALDLASACGGAGGGDATGLESTVTGLMQGLDQAELRTFAESIMSEPSSMQSLMGMVGRLTTGGGAQSADMNPQIQGLMSMVNTMAGASNLMQQ